VEKLYKTVFDSAAVEWPELSGLCEKFKFPNIDDFKTCSGKDWKTVGVCSGLKENKE
jgi:hypothetical protein